MAVNYPALHHPTGNDAATSAAIALLIHYFDLAPASAQLLVKKWLVNYPALWIRAAVTEALYQGRYKPFSVEQILAFWQRRGKAISHFNKEFETIIAVPLKGVLPSETTEEVTATNGQPSLDLESLAVGLSSAEQAQAESEAVPRPRLMLPGELPGTSLVQQSSTASEPKEASGSTRNQASPQSITSTASAKPKGFDGILDPRPRPQVTQGPDSALVAESKAKPIQPLSIGPFTPAADPSGFSSRLKAVVEQAIAKQASNNSAAQPQAEAEQSSLRDAIQTQIEQLQAAASNSDATEEPAIDFKDAPALASTPETVATDDATADAEPVITPVPLVSESQAALQAADQELPETDPPVAKEAETSETETSEPEVSSSQTALPLVAAQPIASEEPDPWETDISPSASEPASDWSTESEAIAIPDRTDVQDNAELPEVPPSDVNAPSVTEDSPNATEIELPAAFEARFPLTNGQDAESPHREKDEMDLALDQRLGETSLEQGSKNRPAVDTLNHHASGKLLDGDALNRHLEADFDLDEACPQESELTQDEALLDQAERSLETNPTSNLDVAPEVDPLEQAASAEAVQPAHQSKAAQDAGRPNETVLELSQISNLMAGLSQQQQNAQLENFSLADLASLEVPLTSPNQNDLEGQDD